MAPKRLGLKAAVRDLDPAFPSDTGLLDAAEGHAAVEFTGGVGPDRAGIESPVIDSVRPSAAVRHGPLMSNVPGAGFRLG